MKTTKFKVQEELPPGKAVRDEPIDWEGAKAALIENEGKWVLIAEDVAMSTTGVLKRGDNKHFRGEELEHFEFKTRKPEAPAKPYGPRRTDLWGRFSA